MTRTSNNSPLRISSVLVPKCDGRIGMTICPGKQGPSKLGPTWKRDLRSDLSVIKDWGAASLVTVMEPDELKMLKVENLGHEVSHAGMTWHLLPIADGCTPDARIDKIWPSECAKILMELREGRSVVIHCRGGLGRTGMIAAMILIESGMSPDAAVETIRKARPGAIETEEQMRYVMNYRSQIAPLRGPTRGK